MASLIFRSTEALLKNCVGAKWYVHYIVLQLSLSTHLNYRAPISCAKLNTTVTVNAAQKDAVLKNEVAFLTQEELEQKNKLQDYITVQPVMNFVSTQKKFRN